ncbi:MAG: hypothetical protein LBU40_00725 [Methanobrevibacter sp.]|jgi:uncharacterized Zn finger protein|nr:hypothetical protein [Methanobrevibacter sp.]
MVIELRSWWTIRWFDLINNKDLEKKFFRGKESYEKLIRSNLDYKIKGNKILDLEYDRSFFGENFNPSIKFKKFNEKEINIIKDTILNSSFYLIKLSKNQLPEKLFEDLNKQDINLIPNSIEELEFVGNGSKGYCDENMAMFYSFGFKINKNPLLLFKIKGFNIDGIIEEYEQINTNKIKKIKDICFNKEETKEDKNKSNKIEILKTIDFNKIPNLKNIIELLVSNRTEFFKGDFRKILIKNMEYWSKYNPETKLKIFLEDNYNFKINKKSIKNSFNYIWSQTNEFKKFKININENYKITRVTGLEYTQNMENRMYYFFDEIPKEEVSKYNYNIQFSYTLFKFAKKLVEKVAIIPELLKNENNHFLIRWIPGLFNEEINEIFEKLVDLCPLDLISFNEKEISKEEQTKILLSLFLKVIIKERNLLSFHELRDSKKSNIEINTNVYNLFFKGTIKKFSKEDIILVNKWISKLSSFEINRDLFVNVEEKDKTFIIALKSEKFDSLKEALEKSDITYKFKILSEIELLGEYFEDINDLVDKNKKINYDLSEFGEFYLEIIPILNILIFKVKIPKNL